MNKKNIQLFCLSAACGFSALQGMQQAMQRLHLESTIDIVQQSEQQYKVITGDLCIQGSFMYAGYPQKNDLMKQNIFSCLEDHLQDLEGNVIRLKPQDILVSVKVMSEDSDDWSYHSLFGVYAFPSFLPISFFESKQEGATIEFLFKGCKVVLNCKGASGAYFETVLAFKKQEFWRAPNYWLLDAEQLINDGILAKYTIISGEAVFYHGPQGFKLPEVADRDDENGRCVIN